MTSLFISYLLPIFFHRGDEPTTLSPCLVSNVHLLDPVSREAELCCILQHYGIQAPIFQKVFRSSTPAGIQCLGGGYFSKTKKLNHGFSDVLPPVIPKLLNPSSAPFYSLSLQVCPYSSPWLSVIGGSNSFGISTGNFVCLCLHAQRQPRAQRASQGTWTVYVTH